MLPYSTQQPLNARENSACYVNPTITTCRTVPFRRNIRWRRIKRRQRARNHVIREKDGSITESRAATTIRANVAAVIPDVSVHTSADTVGDPTHTIDARGVPIQTPLKYAGWEYALRNHPDPEYKAFILDGIRNGVSIGYVGNIQPRVRDNWPSAYIYRSAVESSIQKDLNKGRKLGPFDIPPNPDIFIGSPMGAFEKKRSPGKYRIIHDLSFPPHNSVNESIAGDCSVHYITIDIITQRIQQFNTTGVKMCKLDLEDAYKHIPIKPEDRPLLGTTWKYIDENGNSIKQYFVDTVLPFGLKSSAKLFNKYADGLEYIMKQNGVSNVEHYLDDYFSCGHPTSMECEANLAIMTYTCKCLGFSVQPRKLVYATTVMEYLGIEINTDIMELRISDVRLKEVLIELNKWRYKDSCTKRELLSLIGKLSFVSRVVRSGRTFVRRLIDLSKTARHLHYKIRLDECARDDIRWWIAYLPTWNGVSVFYDQEWTSNIDIALWTDSSDWGYGAYHHNSWIYEPFTDDLVSHSIAWRELYAIVKASATWASNLKGKRVKFYCDNSTVCDVLKSGTSKSPDIMILVRSLFFVAAGNSFEFTAEHLSSRDNSAADTLSRGQIESNVDR